MGCKGCKRECPTGVDMARMKIEFLAHYKARHGYSLRDRLIAKLPDYAAAASRFAVAFEPSRDSARRAPARASGCSDSRGQALAAALAHRYFLARSRRGPRWASREAVLEAALLGKQGRGAVRRHVQRRRSSARTRIAAARVLRAAGYLVHALPRRGAAARTLLLRPNLPERRHGRRGPGQGPRELISALEEFARRGIAIVGLEPSCLLTLARRSARHGISARARGSSPLRRLLFEEFVARESRAGRFSLELRARGPPDARAWPLPSEGIRGGELRFSRCSR